ncbi:MAG: DUF3568 family protein [Candidatus Omnitrophica bacterium]|nr:DUF3568 family protein [Candidatus Omnitrophota bacterium]
MKRNALIVLCIILIISTGCVPVLIGGAGIVTGYMMSNDSAIGDVRVSYRELWDISIEVLQNSDKVEIIETNESKGRIKIKMDGVDLTVKINTLDSENQQLKVSARKYMLPKPKYAQKIFFNIVKELE